MTALPRRLFSSRPRVRLDECGLRQNASARGCDYDHDHDYGHEQNASARPRLRRVDVESPAR